MVFWNFIGMLKEAIPEQHSFSRVRWQKSRNWEKIPFPSRGKNCFIISEIHGLIKRSLVENRVKSFVEEFWKRLGPICIQTSYSLSFDEWLALNIVE